LPTNCNMSASSKPSVTKTSVNIGSPLVTVPVLSNTTVSIDCVLSKCSPPLNRPLICADLHEPSMLEVGVASPSAHGHAITKIEIIGIKLERKSPGVTTKYQMRNVTTAIATTNGTNTPEILSASRWMSAFDPCASSTTLTICDRAVSFPTFVAVICRDPFLLIVAP